MGYYINALPSGEVLPAKGKADKLLTIPGARELDGTPQQWQENLVCVVNNGLFEAAGHAFDAHEMDVFAYPDGRPKRWLVIPNAESLAK